MRLFFLFAVLVLLTGCSCMPWEEAKLNIDNSKALRVGMTKEDALKVMGPPVSGEVYGRPDLWYYYIKTEWADGLTTEDECMPLVFDDGRLVGWGNQFYTKYRMTGDSRVKEVKLPTGK